MRATTQRLILESSDPSVARELAAVLPKGCSLDRPRSGRESGIFLVDADTVPLKALRKRSETDITVALTARAETDFIMEIIAHGAYEVVHRPFDRGVLQRVLAGILGIAAELLSPIEIGPSHPVPTCAIVGKSPGVMEMCKRLARLSQVDVPVLITGETGTGKELIAESIAQYSNRFGKPFVVINCASVPETLLESELFGFEKGAFTGAMAPKAGLLRVADGGTVFLDEVGELPLPLQAKLLRFLQTQTFYPIGSTAEVQVDVRVVSATNRDLGSMVRMGTFREDLFHRLCVSSIAVPPLRERKMDILPLVRFFIHRYRTTAPRPLKGITAAFLDELLAYDWPGNIRELENVVRSAMAVVKTNYFTTLELRDLRRGHVPRTTTAPRDTLAAAAADRTQEALRRNETNLYETIHGEVDRGLLPYVLSHTRENQSEAARLLGISRLTLRKKLGYGTGDREGA